MLALTPPAFGGWSIIGHERAVRMLRRSIQSQRVGHAYLFTGPEGIGKRTLALAFAMSLNCQAKSSLGQSAPDLPCGLCPSCSRIAHGNHPDLAEVNLEIQARLLGDASSKNKSGPSKELKIDTIRDTLSQVGLRPYSARWKVYIIGDAERLSEEASNCLLKTLEEPPGHAVLILLASDRDAVLPTISSRCIQIPLLPLPAGQIASGLSDRWAASPEQAERLAAIAGGRMGYAVKMLQDRQSLQTRSKALGEVALLSGATISDRISAAARYAKLFTDARAELYEMLAIWESWWRDVLVVKAGAPELALNADQLTALLSTASRASVEKASNALKLIQRTRQELQENVNPRLALEALALGLP